MPATRPAFFTSEFLAQLERLSLLSRRIFRGRVKGERRSLRRGHSVEFCDYRAYGVGDDLRYVDWNIYGRLDRLHVKLFVDEEDLCLHLIVDASASMNFGTPSKLACAVRIAAALGFVGLVNLERVDVGVHLVDVLWQEEMNPELAGDLRLSDSETGEIRELSMDGDAVRAYRERLRQYLDRVETFCRTKEIGYHRMTSDSPIESFVLAQLRGRVVA